MSDSAETLARVVAGATYRPEWKLRLQVDPVTDQPEWLRVHRHVTDAYHPERRIYDTHQMAVPDEDRDRDGWAVWLRDTLALIERHEANEWLLIDGRRLFAPSHGPWPAPYV